VAEYEANPSLHPNRTTRGISSLARFTAGEPWGSREAMMEAANSRASSEERLAAPVAETDAQRAQIGVIDGR